MKNQIQPQEKIYVWDRLVRAFHWLLVVGVALAITFQEQREIHRWIGYVIAGLVMIRLIWGFIGSHHARFSHFVATPKGVIRYCKSLCKGSEKTYEGHNPLGALMIIALIITLSGLIVTGHLMGMEQFWGEEWVEEIHESFYIILLSLIPIHVLGVVFGSWREKQNLIVAMLTGYKKRHNR